MTIEAVLVAVGLLLILAPLGAEVRGLRLPELVTTGKKAACAAVGLLLFVSGVALHLKSSEPSQKAASNDSAAVNTAIDERIWENLVEGVQQTTESSSEPGMAAPDVEPDPQSSPRPQVTSTNSRARSGEPARASAEPRGSGGVSATNGSIAVGGSVTGSNIVADSSRDREAEEPK